MSILNKFNRRPEAKGFIPCELSDLPLFWDIVVLPGLMYYLWDGMHFAPPSMLLDFLQGYCVPQRVVKYERNERRGDINYIKYRDEYYKEGDEYSSFHFQKWALKINIAFMQVRFDR
jgi:hypothetical protein